MFFLRYKFSSLLVQSKSNNFQEFISVECVIVVYDYRLQIDICSLVWALPSFGTYI